MTTAAPAPTLQARPAGTDNPGPAAPEVSPYRRITEDLFRRYGTPVQRRTERRP